LSNFSKEFYHWSMVGHKESQHVRVWLRWELS